MKKSLSMKGVTKMKKNNLFIGIGYMLLGIALLFISLQFNTKLDSLLFGFSGACIGPGVMLIFKYYYWNLPKNKNKYNERIENENIELHDERKEKLRDKSGRYAYILGLVVVSLSIFAFSILGKLEIVQNSKLIIFYLGGYGIFQLIIGVIIFRHLSKKY